MKHTSSNVDNNSQQESVCLSDAGVVSTFINHMPLPRYVIPGSTTYGSTVVVGISSITPNDSCISLAISSACRLVFRTDLADPAEKATALGAHCLGPALGTP
jgi:hypothetical protein